MSVHLARALPGSAIFGSLSALGPPGTAFLAV